MAVRNPLSTPLSPEDDSTSYEQLLRLRGLRATRNRINILRTLNRKDFHPTISQLYRRLKEADPDYQHSALYSSLRELTNNGIVRMVMHPAGEECLDGWQTPHHNLICKGCGLFYDLEFDLLDTQPLAQQVQQLGFHISTPLQISLAVTCPTCLGLAPSNDPASS